MFDVISLIILREIFIRIKNQKDIIKFKISLKRISSFVNKDPVCQKHYLKIGFNLKINLNKNDHFKTYENLIINLESKIYSIFFRPGFKWTPNRRIFIRPSDDFVITFEKSIHPFENNYFLIGCVESRMLIELQKSIEKEDDNFENIMNSNGFFQITILYSFIRRCYGEICYNNKNLFVCFNFSEDFKKHYIDHVTKIATHYYNNDIRLEF